MIYLSDPEYNAIHHVIWVYCAYDWRYFYPLFQMRLAIRCDGSA